MAREGKSHLAGRCVALASFWVAASVHAFDIPTGREDFTAKWDNTLKYSAARRLENPSAELTSPSANHNNQNLNDGDLNFNKGLISSRVDLLSELDVAYRAFGLRATAAAWYDSVYNRGNDNPGLATNQLSVPGNQFTRATRRVHGRGAEWLDAFVYGGANFGSDQRLSFRLGRHALVWGETFFFGANGIAGGMMPVDVVKLSSVPNTQFKEAIRPVPMVSGSFQLTRNTSVGAYYQFRWAPSRLPAVGSYFSFVDNLPEGGERLLFDGYSPFLNDVVRGPDAKAKNAGQGGLQLRTRVGQTDLGAYLIRFHSKTPQPVVGVGLAPVAFIPGQGCVIPNGPLAGGGSVNTSATTCSAVGPVSFRVAYPEAITSLGFSASQTFGAVNLAAEVSIRRNQDLSSGRTADTSALFNAPPSDNAGNPAYPIGKTAHVNVSALWAIDPNPLFREGQLIAEVGWSRVLSVQKNAAEMDPTASRDAVALRGIFTTTHRQVLPGVDLAPLLGIGWAPKGSRSPITTSSMPQNGNGDVTLAMEATYLDVWRANVSFTHYLGDAGSFLVPAGSANSVGFRQFFADRDFIALSLRRSF